MAEILTLDNLHKQKNTSQKANDAAEKILQEIEFLHYQTGINTMVIALVLEYAKESGLTQDKFNDLWKRKFGEDFQSEMLEELYANNLLKTE